MARDSCLARVGAGVAVGGAVGGAVVPQWLPANCGVEGLDVYSLTLLLATQRGCFRMTEDENCVKNCIEGPPLHKRKKRSHFSAVYGTYEAVRCKIPGLLKIRYIGQTTVGSAAIFGLFLGCGSLIHCGKSY